MTLHALLPETPPPRGVSEGGRWGYGSSAPPADSGDPLNQRAGPLRHLSQAEPRDRSWPAGP